MQPAVAVSLIGLGKRFFTPTSLRPVWALVDFSMEVAPGEAIGLCGGNGSGKSTLLKVIVGLLQPTRGQCAIYGQTAGLERRRHLGYLPESPQLPPMLSAREWVTWHANLAGLRGAGRKQAVDGVLERVGLVAAADRPLSSYSKGMLQRAGLAQAIVHRPSILLLDEPTAGVDEGGVEDIRRLLASLKADGCTLLLTSHVRDDLRRLCDQLIFLKHGRQMGEALVSQAERASDRQVLVVDPLTTAEEAELDEWLEQRGRRRYDRGASSPQAEQPLTTTGR